MKTKKFTFLLCTLCFLFAIFTLPVAAKSKNVPKKLFLSRKEILLYVGESKNLWVEKVRPAKASAKVTWKSKKPKIAFVSKNGKVTAKKAGKTVITAAAKKNPKVKALVKVTIKKRPKKQEKDCVFQANSYPGTISAPPQAEQHGAPIIIRSKEDFDEIMNPLLTSHRFDNYPDTRNSFLSEYANMDFKKDSLIVFVAKGYSAEVLSCSTNLDTSGKLQCLLKVRSHGGFSSSDGHVTLPYMPCCNIALKINRKNEAMIDYFQINYF